MTSGCMSHNASTKYLTSLTPIFRSFARSQLGKSTADSKFDLGKLRTECTYECLDPYLKALSDRKVPMFSANPDLKVVTPSNEISYMPGVICKR